MQAQDLSIARRFKRAYRPRFGCPGCAGRVTVFRCQEAGVEDGPDGRRRGYARVIRCVECGHTERVNG